eukprot:3801909-Prymnesium_polylepis.1
MAWGGARGMRRGVARGMRRGLHLRRVLKVERRADDGHTRGGLARAVGGELDDDRVLDEREVLRVLRGSRAWGRGHVVMGHDGVHVGSRGGHPLDAKGGGA